MLGYGVAYAWAYRVSAFFLHQDTSLRKDKHCFCCKLALVTQQRLSSERRAQHILACLRPLLSRTTRLQLSCIMLLVGLSAATFAARSPSSMPARCVLLQPGVALVQARRAVQPVRCGESQSSPSVTKKRTTGPPFLPPVTPNVRRRRCCSEASVPSSASLSSSAPAACSSASGVFFASVCLSCWPGMCLPWLVFAGSWALSWCHVLGPRRQGKLETTAVLCHRGECHDSELNLTRICRRAAAAAAAAGAA